MASETKTDSPESALEAQILEYLKDRRSAEADQLVSAVTRRHHFLPLATVVSAIWRLSDQNMIRVGPDWMIESLENRANQEQPFTKKAYNE
jgi:predicted transcriptional regulator